MFTHLHVHSHYSFHAGASRPAELVRRAAELGMEALALTDTNGLYGAVEFFKACEAAGLRALIGAEVDAGGTPAAESGAAAAAGEEAAGAEAARAVVLARNEAGYQALCRLVTARHLDAAFELPAALAAGAATGDVIILSHAAPLLVELARRGVGKRRGEPLVFGEIRALPEVNPARRICQAAQRRNLQVLDACAKAGYPIVGTNHVFFAHPAQHLVHRLLRAIGLRTTLGLLDPAAAVGAHCFLKSPRQMAELFRDLPEAVRNSRVIAEQCAFRFRLGEPVFPRFRPQGQAAGDGAAAWSPASARTFLQRLAEEGLRWRYGARPRRSARQRLARELEVIERLGFSDYFLVVWDIVAYARSRRYPCLGRGSAANSIVAYCLGITHVDPLDHNLFFERFMNPERTTPPDIDLDFGTRRRDDVLGYVYRTYGDDHVAMICTMNRYAARSAAREIGKAFGLPEAELRRYARQIPHARAAHLPHLRQRYPECRDLEVEREPLRTILLLGQALDDVPRHLSIHCGGIVITPDPITNHVPLERAAKEFIITQMDMVPIEDLGLIKIDLLGNRSLDVLPDTLEALRARLAARCGTGEEGNGGSPGSPGSEGGRQGRRGGSACGIAAKVPDVEDFARIFADRATQDLIARGATIGCFYIESPAMRSLLRKLRVRDFPSLTAASSIIRPGVAESGMMRQYLACFHEPRRAVYYHPLMEELLRETFGVMVYQEDVIKVAHKLAGMSLGEADLLRRAMSGKMRSQEAMERSRGAFLTACAGNGISPAVAREIFRQIESFAGYSFCKAHSASFALLSFQVAYLKAHHPAAFLAAVLSNGGGFYGPWAYLSEVRRLGLDVLPPDVSASDVASTGSDAARGGVVRIGLGALKGISRETLASIVAARRQRPFSSLFDFLARGRPELEEARRLIRCGALEGVGRAMRGWGGRPQGLTRAELMWLLELQFAAARQVADSLFPDDSMARVTPFLPPLPDYPEEVKLREELAALDFLLTRQPLSFYGAAAARHGCVPAAELPRFAGKRVAALGWKIAEKRTVVRRSGESMKFLSLEDESDTFEVTLFPDVYRRVAPQTRGYGPFLVSGRVEEEFGVVSITAQRLENLDFLADFPGAGRGDAGAGFSFGEGTPECTAGSPQGIPRAAYAPRPARPRGASNGWLHAGGGQGEAARCDRGRPK
ncbi:MAG: DNA polymerase III subunit alpha [Candidatus Tectomicrobia bacterium]|nr:DNA polymerase III subunit alpha [Candidatus Tectomicrobia bacterium]